LFFPKTDVNKSDGKSLEDTKNKTMNTVFVSFRVKKAAIKFLDWFEDKITGFGAII